MSAEEDLAGADELYRENILDHYKNPRNAGTLDPADVVHDGDNPVCGDQIKVYARVDAKGKLTDVKFQGKGCAISQASASILFEDVKGKHLDEVKTMDRETIFKLLGMELNASRVKCGVLGLLTLKHGIQEYEAARTAPKKPAASPGLRLNKL